MNKNRIKITENELKQIVTESVNEVLKESSFKEELELVNGLKVLRAAVRKNMPIIDKNCDSGNEDDRLGMIWTYALSLMQEIDEYLKG